MTSSKLLATDMWLAGVWASTTLDWHWQPLVHSARTMPMCSYDSRYVTVTVVTLPVCGASGTTEGGKNCGSEAMQHGHECKAKQEGGVDAVQTATCQRPCVCSPNMKIREGISTCDEHGGRASSSPDSCAARCAGCVQGASLYPHRGDRPKQGMPANTTISEAKLE